MLEGLTDRIRQRCDAVGISYRAASLAAGLKDGAVGDILSGKSKYPGAETLWKLCAPLQCRLEWLISGEGPVDDAGQWSAPASSAIQLSSGMIELDGSEFASVPRFDAGLSAGPGCILPAHPEPEGYQLFEYQWLRSITRSKPSQLALLRVDGESMTETLNDGDWVLVDREQTNPAREGIYALHVDDVAWVKRLSVNKGNRTVRIISDNSKWDAQEWPEEAVRVIGRVVWLAGRKVL